MWDNKANFLIDKIQFTIVSCNEIKTRKINNQLHFESEPETSAFVQIDLYIDWLPVTIF